jgi:hypothetical protein
MASTYSDLKIELIGTGEQSGTWGTTTNNNLGTALSEAITGSANVAFSSGDVTLTLTDTNNAQTARNLRLNLTGTTAGARNLILGSNCQIEKLYLVNNTCADAITVKNTSGTGIAVAAGVSMFVFNNGTNVVDALSYFSGTVVSSSATITGGTINGTSVGASTASTGAFTTLSASGNSTLTGTLGVTGNATFTNDLTVNGNTTLGNASGDTITLNAATATIPNNLNFSGTGTVRLPNGTTGQRPTPAAGMIRYNTTSGLFEGYTTQWGGIGGASADGAIYENAQSISNNYTMSTNFNGESVGPITVASGVTVTIPSGSRWVVL